MLVWNIISSILWHACVEYYFKTNCRPNHENKVKLNRQSLDSISYSA